MQHPLGHLLQYLRAERDITLAQLAATLGTAAATLSRCERGYDELPAGWAQRIAEALRVDVLPILALTKLPLRDEAADLARYASLREAGCVFTSRTGGHDPAADYIASAQDDEIAILHIYAQTGPHDEAFVMGNGWGLLALRDAIDGALASEAGPQLGMCRPLVGDGEGYDLHVVLHEPTGRYPLAGYQDTPLPYTGVVMRASDASVSPWNLVKAGQAAVAAAEGRG